MAKKVDAPKAKAPPQPKGAQDLAILHPEQAITIAGRNLIVREYGFVEGLKLRSLTQPILDAFYTSVTDADSPPELESILAILADHAQALVQLMAIAADVEEAWVAQLNQDDGYLLMMVWWTVNGPFFVRRAINRKVANLAVAKARAGQMSMPPSSQQGTETEPQQASAD